MLILGTLKRGDTFAYTAVIKDNDKLVTGIASKLRSQIRSKRGKSLVAELSVVELDTPGTYRFKHEGSTQSWETTDHYIDIQYTSEGVISSSETFVLHVVEDITYDED